ncbi:MAG: CehA/McbA family metallohydrolase, partial [Proteobacteria bacterium]|nr:CehA/McbA family metallohydrolase [Pseudomonadota bacterium]
VDHRIGFQGRAIPAVIAEVNAAGGVFIVNHPVLDLGDLCIGCAWNHPDTPWDQVAAMELITGNFDIGVNAFVPRVIDLWETQLAAGHHIAIVGGSDDHTAGKSTGPTDSPIGSPTTLVLADALSEAAIIDGVKHGRTMVKLNGPAAPDLDVTMTTADGGVAEIGDDVDGVGHVTLPASIAHGAGGFVQLWRDGAKVSSTPIVGDDFTTMLSDTPGAGDFRYRVEIINDINQRVVVTSHFYVHAIAAPDDGGCGCGATRPASALPLVIVGLALRRRRRPAR